MSTSNQSKSLKEIQVGQYEYLLVTTESNAPYAHLRVFPWLYTREVVGMLGEIEAVYDKYFKIALKNAGGRTE